MSRTLIITTPRNWGYRDMCLADARKRGEAPVALRIGTPDGYRIAERWIDVAERLVVYSDFDLPDEAWMLVADAEMLGVEVEIRVLGSRRTPSIRERIAAVLAA